MVEQVFASIKELAELVSLSKRTLEKRFAEFGAPPIYRIGGSYRYKISEFLQWMEQFEVTPKENPSVESTGSNPLTTQKEGISERQETN